jgi:HEAT repeat protein
MIALVLLAPPVVSAEGETAEVATLAARYDDLLAYRDFLSFSQRMQVIRDLGKIPTPEAKAVLTRIFRKAELVDDKVVALISIGPQLDAGGAARMGALVARRAGPILVQSLGECYALLEDEAALTWLATAALRDKRRSTVEAALHAQYVHADPRATPRILELYAEHAPKREGMAIAYAAVRALGSIGGADARRFLLRAVGHADPRIRLAAADVMARQPLDVNIQGALRQLLADDDPVVKRATARSVGEFRIAEVVPEVIEHLRDDLARTRAVAHEALCGISGKDLGFDPADWLRWWKHRDTTEGPLPKGSSSATTYYGLQMHSDRLLFIVDLSGSMAFPWGKDDTRIGVARKELERVLKGLAPAPGAPPRQGPPPLFNLITFSDKVRAWRTGEAKASAGTVASAVEWVTKVFAEPTGGTFMHAALERAFAENPHIDTIFLLTDGLATDGEPIVPEAMLASVNVWNRYRRVVIHTIALTLEDLDPRGVHETNLGEIKKFMKRVAAATGGESKIVTQPPK